LPAYGSGAELLMSSCRRSRHGFCISMIAVDVLRAVEECNHIKCAGLSTPSGDLLPSPLSPLTNTTYNINSLISVTLGRAYDRGGGLG